MERIKKLTPRLQEVIDELKASIRERYPEATYEVEYGYDPPGFRLIPIVDVEDTADVIHVVGDRLLELQIEEGLPIYVTPSRSPERIEAMTRELLERHPELRKYVAS
ncbi:MAG: hypothetical protein ACKVVP_22695 [Chloroflexota bacterium]